MPKPGITDLHLKIKYRDDRGHIHDIEAYVGPGESRWEQWGADRDTLFKTMPLVQKIQKILEDSDFAPDNDTDL